MAPTQKRIIEEFLEKLTACNEFDAGRRAQLQRLLFAGGKVKPDDLVKIFSTDFGDPPKC